MSRAAQNPVPGRVPPTLQPRPPPPPARQYDQAYVRRLQQQQKAEEITFIVDNCMARFCKKFNQDTVNRILHLLASCKTEIINHLSVQQQQQQECKNSWQNLQAKHDDLQAKHNGLQTVHGQLQGAIEHQQGQVQQLYQMMVDQVTQLQQQQNQLNHFIEELRRQGELNQQNPTPQLLQQVYFQLRRLEEQRQQLAGEREQQKQLEQQLQVQTCQKQAKKTGREEQHRLIMEELSQIRNQQMLSNQQMMDELSAGKRQQVLNETFLRDHVATPMFVVSNACESIEDKLTNILTCPVADEGSRKGKRSLRKTPKVDYKALLKSR